VFKNKELFEMSGKGEPKARHTRTSPLGRKFFAGKGDPKEKGRSSAQAAKGSQQKKDAVKNAIHALDNFDTETLQRQYVNDRIRELSGKIMKPHPLPDWGRLAPEQAKRAREQLTAEFTEHFRGAFPDKSVQVVLDVDSASASKETANWKDGQGEDVRHVGGKLFVDDQEFGFEYEQRTLFGTDRQGGKYLVPGSETVEYKIVDSSQDPVGGVSGTLNPSSDGADTSEEKRTVRRTDSGPVGRYDKALAEQRRIRMTTGKMVAINPKIENEYREHHRGLKGGNED
jgi:hypothetical protein